MRHHLQPHNACNKRKNKNYAQQICRLVKYEYAHEHGAYSANTRPHGVAGAHGDLLCRLVELHRLIVRTLPIDAVGGPVQLFRIIKIADERGVAYFLYILALISVNLGVCNLLPFPVLDGGHLVFLLIEWLMGRPPSPRVRETAQWIGLVCLLLFMMTVTGYDLMHLVKGTG